jgi:hypothetical protein
VGKFNWALGFDKANLSANRAPPPTEVQASSVAP